MKIQLRKLLSIPKELNIFESLISDSLKIHVDSKHAPKSNLWNFFQSITSIETPAI